MKAKKIAPEAAFDVNRKATQEGGEVDNKPCPQRKPARKRDGEVANPRVYVRMDGRSAAPHFIIDQEDADEASRSSSPPKRGETSTNEGSLNDVIGLVSAAFSQSEMLSEKDRGVFAKLVRKGLESIDSCNRERLPTPDLSGKSYLLYPGNAGALEWLEKHWSKYLRYFGADHDSLYQDELRKLDPGLMSALANQVGYRNRKGLMREKLNEIVPPRSARIDVLTQDISEDDLKEMARLVKATRTRKRRLDS